MTGPPEPASAPLRADELDAMRAALHQAREAALGGEVPVGAVILRHGVIIAHAQNRMKRDTDVTAHAEVLAIRAAMRHLSEDRLTGCTLVVTLEPCPMCAGALLLSRVSRLVLGAWDPKLGATGSVWDIVRDRRANHFVEVVSGVRQAECSQLLLDFFAGHR